MNEEHQRGVIHDITIEIAIRQIVSHLRKMPQNYIFQLRNRLEVLSQKLNPPTYH